MRTHLCALVATVQIGAAKEVTHRPAPGSDLSDLIEKAGDGGLGIELSDGVYFVSEALRMTGLSGVAMRAKEGARPVVSGGRRIEGWDHLGGGRWEAKLPGEPWVFRDLYVGGHRATRARHPDAGTFRIAAAGEDRRTGFSFEPGDLRPWADPGGIEFVFYHDWSLSRVAISSIDLETKTVALRDPVGQTTAAHYAMDHFEKRPRYHLENHPDFLTVAGEWFLGEGAGTVTYLARDGEDPNTLEVIAPFAGGLLRLDGCRDLSFEGITFAHTNWNLPPGGCAGVQAAFHQVRPARGVYENRREAKPAAVELVGCADVAFEGCRFEGLSASGLWVKNGCREVVVEGCEFRDIGANALMVGEAGASEEAATRQVTVRRCLIEACGQTDYGAVGVWVGIANHVTVKDCELRQLPYTGISIGWRWSPGATACHHNVVEGCHIHHIMQKLSDGGGIYTLGEQPGTVLRSNRIHDVPVNAGRAESNGMFLDQGTTGISIEGNTIYRIARSPLRFHQAGRNLVRGNTLYRGKEKIPMVRYNNTPEENIRLEDNEDPVGEP